MKLKLLKRNEMFCDAELSAMVIDGELLQYHNAFVALDYVDSPILRQEYLSQMFRSQGTAVGAAIEWVRSGGRLPEDIIFIGHR